MTSKDPYGRKFESLRVSLTQACDFSCVYCVPEGMKFKSLRDELLPDEFDRIIRLLHKLLGLKKLRVTGGEPLRYRHFKEFAQKLGGIGISDKSITTNGSRMEQNAELLWESGFRRINFSLDSLDEEQFKTMSRGGSLQATLKGIEKTLAMGFKLKLNMVPMRTFNLNEVLPVFEFCLERGIELRCIELMKMGHVNSFFEQEFVPQQELLDIISTRYKVERTDASLSSTAVRYKIDGGKGRFGVIANESSPFCAGCDRLRLTSNGFIYGCISAFNSYDVKPLLKQDDAEATAALQKILPAAMGDKQTVSFVGAPTYMKHIGG